MDALKCIFVRNYSCIFAWWFMFICCLFRIFQYHEKRVWWTTGRLGNAGETDQCGQQNCLWTTGKSDRRASHKSGIWRNNCNCQLICKFCVFFKCTSIKQLLTFWYFQTSLQVIVEDVIDHDLTFTQSIYNFNITENDDTPDNVTVHTPVGQVKTMDLDLTKTDLSYRIVTSDVGHIFNVTQVCFVFCIFFSPTVNCLYFCRYKT